MALCSQACGCDLQAPSGQVASKHLQGQASEKMQGAGPPSGWYKGSWGSGWDPSSG